MLLLEIIGKFITEVIIIEVLGAILSRLNNSVLKLRGIETRSIEEIKYHKLRKRYEYKLVKLIRDVHNLKRGTMGIVLEVIDLTFCFVEFKETNDPIKKVKQKDILICK